MWQIALTFLAPLLFQNNPCDPSLKSAPNNPNAYKVQASDPMRCEGVYVQRVSTTGSIVLIGLQNGSGQIDPQKGSITLAWKNPAQAQTRLRAVSVNDVLTYRMDSLVSGGAGTYRWPLGIPAAVGLHAGEVNLVAWTSIDVFTQMRDVYLPVSMPPAPAGTVTASFLPPVGLGKVTLTVAKLRGPNQSQQMPPLLKPGQYPARRRIDFIVGGLDTAGFYELNISGEDAARQPWSDSYVIYLP